MSDQEPYIIGVRHHSPACAHLVAAKIRALRPAFVLIEGPSDFNARMDEFFLPHTLPIALYSYMANAEVHRSSWSPFAAHSPEWQALQVGREVGATLLFIDVPSWSNAFASLENRYADAVDAEAEAAIRAYDDKLAEVFSEAGHDALWDRLFEDRHPSLPMAEHLDQLEIRLKTYFHQLRGDTPGSLGNQVREKMMSAWIAWAMKAQKGSVLVVCGGYHAPQLHRQWRTFSGERPILSRPEDEILEELANVQAERDAAEEGDAAEAAEAAEAEVEVDADVDARKAALTATLRSGTYLVPYSFKRLDSFTGYASGMPSPAYYQWEWESLESPVEAALNPLETKLLREITARLRQKKLWVSTADLISASSRALALSRFRGHARPLRVDWLDALSGALVKEAMEVPLPWSYRGVLKPRTDPTLVEIMDVLSGHSVGRLASGTPQPPLVNAVFDALQAHEIPRQGECRLDLFEPKDREKSRILHRLNILNIPGFERLQGAALALSGEADERWKNSEPFSQLPALIEASCWGASLEGAACAFLEAELQGDDAPGTDQDIEKLAKILNAAAFAGLHSVGLQCLERLKGRIAEAQRFPPLGQLIEVTHALFRHGDLLEMAGSSLLATLISAAYDRALWLFEIPAEIPEADFNAYLRGVRVLVSVVNDVSARLRRMEDNPLVSIVPWQMYAVMLRKTGQHDAAPMSRGAALGALLQLYEEAPEGAAGWNEEALSFLQTLPPSALGDALSGIVAVGREMLMDRPEFIEGLDACIRALDDTDFVIALPSLRGAFAWLPTQERGAVAEMLLKCYGLSTLSRHTLMERFKDTSPEELALFSLREREAIARLRSLGIPMPDAATPTPSSSEQI